MVTEHGAVTQSLQVELNWSIINLEGLAHPFTEIVIKLGNHQMLYPHRQLADNLPKLLRGAR